MTTLEKLDALLLKLRSIPEDRQRLAVEALSDITEDVYVLSDEERAILEPALDDAKRGKNLVDADTLDILNKSWIRG
jgi:uncharacterized protein YjiK